MRSNWSIFSTNLNALVALRFLKSCGIPRVLITLQFVSTSSSQFPKQLIRFLKIFCALSIG